VFRLQSKFNIKRVKCEGVFRRNTHGKEIKILWGGGGEISSKERVPGGSSTKKDDGIQAV